MGKGDDQMAVVDSKGLVFSMEGLRVLDASIIPFCGPGHPTGTICQSSRMQMERKFYDSSLIKYVVALSEKIAHDILGGLHCAQSIDLGEL